MAQQPNNGIEDSDASSIRDFIRYEGWRILAWVCGIPTSLSLLDLWTTRFGFLTSVFSGSAYSYTYACGFSIITFLMTTFSYSKWKKREHLWRGWRKRENDRPKSDNRLYRAVKFSLHHPIRIFAVILCPILFIASIHLFYKYQTRPHSEIIYTHGEVVREFESTDTSLSYVEFEYEADGTRYKAKIQADFLYVGSEIPISYHVDNPRQITILDRLPTREYTEGSVVILMAASILAGLYGIQPKPKSLRELSLRRILDHAMIIPDIFFHVFVASVLGLFLAATVAVTFIGIHTAIKTPEFFTQNQGHIIIFISFIAISLSITTSLGWVYLPILAKKLEGLLGIKMNFDVFPSKNNRDYLNLTDPIWRNRPVTYQPSDENKSSGWNNDHWEREIKVPGADPTKIFEQARARLINFDIMPVDILEVTPSWTIEGRLPHSGDLLFQRTHLLKIGGFRLLDVLSATRIDEVIDEPRRFVLQYTATKGHPEKGTAWYTLEHTDDDRVVFMLKSMSKPANLLTQLGTRIITRPIQLKITRAILDTFAKGVLLDLTGYEDV